LGYLGDWVVICQKCAKKYEARIVEIEEGQMLVCFPCAVCGGVMSYISINGIPICSKCGSKMPCEEKEVK
jgi:hypothetical protein